MFRIAAEQAKGRLILSEVNLIEPVDENTFGGKHIFRIASATNSIFLQAANGIEMTDWSVFLTLICIPCWLCSGWLPSRNSAAVS